MLAGREALNEVESLKSQLGAAREALRFYTTTAGLLKFIKVSQNDPLLNPDGPDTYGLSNELCIPAREALAAMEAKCPSK